MILEEHILFVSSYFNFTCSLLLSSCGLGVIHKYYDNEPTFGTLEGGICLVRSTSYFKERNLSCGLQNS
jgi:hypothetical protein